MARTVLDAALLHEAIGGHDPLDSTSIDAPLPVLAECARRGAEGDLSGLRVGVVRELGGEGHTDGYEDGVLDRVRPSRRAAGEHGRRGPRGLLPGVRPRAGRLLPDRARARRRPTWPASTASGTACGSATTAAATSTRSWR